MAHADRQRAVTMVIVVALAVAASVPYGAERTV